MKERCVKLRPNYPWFNENILTEKKIRRQLESKWRKSHLEIDRQIYCQQKQMVNRQIKRAKSQYYNDLFSEVAKDQRQIFRLTVKLLHRRKSSPLPMCESQKDLAQSFHIFFTDKIKCIRDQFERVSDLQPPTKALSSSKFVGFHEVSINEIQKILSNSPGTTCDLDPIPSALLKKCSDAVLPAMTKIINNSMNLGEIPSSLKAAQIRPMLKKVKLDSSMLANYHSISHLCFLSKTLERMVAKQLSTFLANNNLIDEFQSAYRAHHSVETALLSVHNDLLQAMNCGEITLLVLLDLSAAFDTVDHSILLSRMNSYFGIGGVALDWFQSYLSGRTYCVRIDNVTSVTSQLKYGLPQGSVLGPILFSMYTSPTADIIRKHGLKYHCYADDTQIYISVDPTQSNVNNAIEQIEACLDELRQWMSRNYLKLNNAKTEVIVVGSKQQRSKVNITEVRVGDTMVTPTDSVTNLGVIIDENLSMDKHIAKVSRAVCISIRNIGMIRKHINQPVAELLTHVLITSRLDACNSLLHGLNKTQLIRLQRLQNTAARLVTLTRKCTHITPILKQLHWLPIEQRIVFKISMFVFKTIHCVSPVYLCNLNCTNHSVEICALQTSCC